jgi:prephenate dehydrogenase
MDNFPQEVTIFGVGLIGGSLALALKRAFPEIRIAGVDKPDVLERASQLKIIDTVWAFRETQARAERKPGRAQPEEKPAALTNERPGGPRSASAIARSLDNRPPLQPDLVILATPVGEILRLLDQFTSTQTVVLDVGSTKLAICRKAERLGVPFVGGHPMAGQEHSGPEAASVELFREAPFFLCPIKSTPAGAIERLQGMAKAIGAIPHVISAEGHDRLVAQISHLPQIISTLLADQTAAHKEFAGPGLRSMTRLAGSPFHIWRDIFKTSGFLPEELQSFIERLQRILDSMEGGNFDEIENLFKRGGST